MTTGMPAASASHTVSQNGRFALPEPAPSTTNSPGAFAMPDPFCRFEKRQDGGALQPRIFLSLHFRMT